MHSALGQFFLAANPVQFHSTAQQLLCVLMWQCVPMSVWYQCPSGERETGPLFLVYLRTLYLLFIKVHPFCGGIQV